MPAIEHAEGGFIAVRRGQISAVSESPPTGVSVMT
jgi:hypothetical protein